LRFGPYVPPPRALFFRVVRPPALYRFGSYPYSLEFQGGSGPRPASQAKLGPDRLAPGTRSPEVNEDPPPPSQPPAHWGSGSTPTSTRSQPLWHYRPLSNGSSTGSSRGGPPDCQHSERPTTPLSGRPKENAMIPPSSCQTELPDLPTSRQ